MSSFTRDDLPPFPLPPTPLVKPNIPETPMRIINLPLSKEDRLLWFAAQPEINQLVCEILINPDYTIEGKVLRGDILIKSDKFQKLHSIYSPEDFDNPKLQLVTPDESKDVALPSQNAKGYIFFNSLNIKDDEHYKFTFSLDLSRLNFKMNSSQVHMLFPLVVQVGYLRNAGFPN